MQFGLDFYTLNRSFQFFYGHSLIYLVLAAYFVIRRIKYSEKSNRTSNTYLITRICNMLIVQCLAIGLFSSLNVLIYDVEIDATSSGWVDRLFLSLTLSILFLNSVFPYYLFIVMRKQLHSIGTFQGMLNRTAFVLVSLFCLAFSVFVLKLMIYSAEALETPFCRVFYRVVICLSLAQFLCFLLTIKDVHVFVSELLHGVFLSRRAARVGVILFVYVPTFIWPVTVIFNLPIFFISLVAFVFVVHMVSQSRAVSRDFLTGMNNRNELYRYLSRLFEREEDLTSALNLIFIDINKFKSINDTYGHTQGDKALICLADCLRKSAFSKDCFLSRYAGDEFIVVIKENPENTVSKFIDSLNRNIQKANTTNTDPYRLSIAIGSVSYSEEFDTVEKFIEAADRRMYDKKAESEKISTQLI